jgi:hypothetical protein
MTSQYHYPQYKGQYYMGSSIDQIYHWNVLWLERYPTDPIASLNLIPTAQRNQHSDGLDLLGEAREYRKEFDRASEQYTRLLTQAAFGVGAPATGVQFPLAVTIGFAEGAGVIGGCLLLPDDWLHRDLLPSKFLTQDTLVNLGYLHSPKPPIHWDTMRPELTAEWVAGDILVKWHKGEADALTLRWREPGAAHWHGGGAALGVPGYLDYTPAETERVLEVTGRYLKHNRPVGQWSEPVQVITPPTPQV